MCEHLCVLGINFSLVLYTANVFLPALAFADTQHLSRGISVFRSCSSAICTFASLGGNRVPPDKHALEVPCVRSTSWKLGFRLFVIASFSFGCSRGGHTILADGRFPGVRGIPLRRPPLLLVRKVLPGHHSLASAFRLAVPESSPGLGSPAAPSRCAQF